MHVLLYLAAMAHPGASELKYPALYLLPSSVINDGHIFNPLIQIHANCRIRRVYFSDRLYSEDELPAEFKLYLPVQNKTKA